MLGEKSQTEDLVYFIDCAGSPLLHRLFSRRGEPGLLSIVAVCGLLVAANSPVAERGI